MKILLTRPEGQNQAMANKLAAKNIEYFISPLLSVQANAHAKQAINKVSQADYWIFVSANAVKFAASLLDQSLPSQVTYFAVGHATWSALAELGVNAIRPCDKSQDSEGLLELEQLDAVQNKKIIIVRGNGGRELLGQVLSNRGANVDYWQVYQRQCPALDGALLVKQWQNFGIDTLILPSRTQLDNLIQLIPKALFPWLCDCHIIVTNESAQQHARAKGMRRVTNAKGAHPQALLNALNLS